MAKRSQPALYELIRNRPDSSEPVVPVRGGSPPRPITLTPVAAGGAVAVVLAIVIGAYLYGHAVGAKSVRTRLGEQAARDLDSLANASGRESGNRAAEPPPDATPTLGRESAPPPAATPVPAPLPGGDPRVDGLNYFVLAQVPPESADRMVAFCRERDLDAHSVPDDTGGLRFVIVMPGFAAGDRRAEPVVRLEAKIRSVGLQWKSAARGNRDFSDFYPRKYAAKPG